MLIILDRDGVINEERDDYIKNPAEWVPIPGSLSSIGALTRAGHCLVVASNQSGVGRGLFTEETLTRIHDTMREAMLSWGGRIDQIFYCPHHPSDDCVCRKPKPGMLHAIASHYAVDLATEALMIGDAERDVACAKAAGCPVVLVKTGRGLQTLERYGAVWGNEVPVFDDLASVASALLSGALLSRFGV